MQASTPQWPLKVLVLSSDPRDASRMRLGDEQRALQTAIRGTRHGSSLDVVIQPSCRYSDITATLDRESPRILHFSGHGGEDVLYFEDESGNAIPVRKGGLARVLSHQDELQLVILNACFSREQGQIFANAVGSAIVLEGRTSDRDAIDFAREFYTALGHGGRSYQKAFDIASSALEMTSDVKVQFLPSETKDTRNRGQLVSATNPTEPGNSQDGGGTHTTTSTNALTTPVATNGAALRTAVESSASRRSIIPLIVRFDDALLFELQRHGRRPNDSYVQFYCNVHMPRDPIPWVVWEFMVKALAMTMQGVTFMNQSVPPDRLFGGFQADSLRQMRE